MCHQATTIECCVTSYQLMMIFIRSHKNLKKWAFLLIQNSEVDKTALEYIRGKIRKYNIEPDITSINFPSAHGYNL